MGPPVVAPRLAPDALVMADGARLPLHAWLPASRPRAIILGLHGMNEHARAFAEDAAPWFTARGIGLYAYDQRGFGAAPNRGIWPGHATLAADAAEAARLIAARHAGLPLILMGESMGAAVVVVAATSPAPPPAAGHVLLAPAVVSRAALGWFARHALDFLTAVVPMMGVENAAPGFQPTDNLDAWRRWSRDPLLIRNTRIDAIAGLVELMDAAVAAAPRFGAPALVLFGARDRLVPARRFREFLALLPRGADQRVGYYAQGWHMLLRDTQGETVARDIVAWIENRAAPLPSGADRAAQAWLAA
jgi:alpha-beta hydrolase superfamily lysophospholipase